jgi:hypothetical protein
MPKKPVPVDFKAVIARSTDTQFQGVENIYTVFRQMMENPPPDTKLELVTNPTGEMTLVATYKLPEEYRAAVEGGVSQSYSMGCKED